MEKSVWVQVPFFTPKERRLCSNKVSAFPIKRNLLPRSESCGAAQFDCFLSLLWYIIKKIIFA